MTFLHAMATLWPKRKQIFQPANKRHFVLVMPGRHFLLAICFLLFSTGVAWSQSPEREAVDNIQPLNIGDPIPDALWDTPLQVVNHPDGKETITLSEYKDKLIILDFWATWCGSCIANFPKVNDLQKQNEEHMQVLLVNTITARDDNDKIKRFLKQQEQSYSFTSVIEDRMLEKLFPHRTVPHYIWIKDKKLLAVSKAEDITSENVTAAIKDGSIKVSLAPEVKYSPRHQLFENGNGGDAPAYIHRSILSPYVNGLRTTSNSGRDKSGQITRQTFTNARIIDLYSFAYPEITAHIPARFILDMENQEPFAVDSTSLAWNIKHRYNYEVQFPAASEEKARQVIREDLQKFFGYKVHSASKEMECWIVRVDKDSKARDFPSNLSSETNIFKNDGLEKFFNNYPLSILLETLESLYKEPFISETGFDYPVKLSLPLNLSNIEELTTALHRQGINLSKEKRTVPVIILSQHN